MFSEKIKKQNIYSKIILLIAAIMLATVFLPVRVHAASATKTKKVTMRVGQKVQLQLKGIEPTELKWKGNNKKSLKVYKKTGIIRAKKKGTVVVTTKYDGVTYKFKVKIKKRKKNQSTEIRTETCRLKKETILESDATVLIPMKHNVDSLNVAAAAAVAFWEMRK